MPEAVLQLVGIPPQADPAILAYSAMLGSIGALALGGVAIAVGTAAVAGEESARTLHLVLGAQVSRVGFAAAKAAAIVTLVAAAGLALWGMAEAAPQTIGMDVGQAKLLALVMHLSANTLFYGTLAFGVGAATGRTAVAGGVAAAVMVLGWLAAGLRPLWREDAARWVPWNWFEGSQPLVNGVDAADMALLLGGSLLFLAAGMALFVRRELTVNQGGPSIMARCVSCR